MDPILELARGARASRSSRTPARPSARATRAAPVGTLRGLRRALVLPDQEPGRARGRRRHPGERPRARAAAAPPPQRRARAIATATRCWASTAGWTSSRPRSCAWASSTSPPGPKRRRALAAIYRRRARGMRASACPVEQPYARAVDHLFVVRHPRRDALWRAPRRARDRDPHPLPDPAPPAAGLRPLGRQARRPAGGREGRPRGPLAAPLPGADRRPGARGGGGRARARSTLAGDGA